MEQQDLLVEDKIVKLPVKPELERVKAVIDSVSFIT
jgi:hypothetical protein